MKEERREKKLSSLLPLVCSNDRCGSGDGDSSSARGLETERTLEKRKGVRTFKSSKRGRLRRLLLIVPFLSLVLSPREP